MTHDNCDESDATITCKANIECQKNVAIKEFRRPHCSTQRCLQNPVNHQK